MKQVLSLSEAHLSRMPAASSWVLEIQA